MRESKWLCFPRKHRGDVATDDEMSEDENDSEGYERLNDSGKNEETPDKIITPRHDGEQEAEGQRLRDDQPYSKKDWKAKKLSRKLRRKEVSSKINLWPAFGMLALEN
ncbi:hypothetical protein ElyMa_006381100 [Elysia marginata]|uniref:Uncharacterized protein n=1 Tax=Elysia marginata TaxID=1093978 RepID=A0AAV4HQL2_9GAST|nr:hypothetical protein ElyMa_006381100 [Elysia marginata]